MRPLKVTLIADGPSDRALLAVMSWMLRGAQVAHETPVLADLRPLPNPPRELAERARIAVQLHPCDVLVVHRDAEAMPWSVRRDEIRQAVSALGVAHVAAVPVRMTEAWLLLDEAALRRAAGNPNGTESLSIPSLQRLESLIDAKKTLYDLLRKACGLSGRRLASFRPQPAVQTLSHEILDFSPLRALPAFVEFESELAGFIETFLG